METWLFFNIQSNKGLLFLNMNYFFGIKNNSIFSEIQIPCFQNRTGKSEELSLYEGSISDGNWKFKELNNCKVNSDFFIVQNEIIDNEKIFFICHPNEVSNLENNELKNLNPYLLYIYKI